ncbi:hypothetical protein quinque_016218 [Culex quinquefasciatus]
MVLFLADHVWAGLCYERGLCGVIYTCELAMSPGDRCHGVSWMRKRDLHILTSDIHTYTGDQRFSVLHPPDSDDWDLKIEYAQQKDSGIYECQVNTEPKINLAILLDVTVPEMSNPPAPNAQQQGAPAAPVFINSSIPFPEPLSLNGNLRENVELWKESFETYCIASGVEQLPERVQIATFKSALGPSARKIFNLWPLQPADKDTVAKCLTALSTYMIPQKNVKLVRYEFSQLRQESGDGAGEAESMSGFINRARAMVKECNYGDLEDEMLRDKIITGIRDMSLKKKMIETENLTSVRVIEMCQAEEATRFEMERNRLLGAEQHSVNKIAGDRHQNKRCSFCGKAYHTNLLDCPARGATCNYCQLKNHYETVCKKRKEDEKKQSSSTKKRNRKQVNTVEEPERTVKVTRNL